MNQYSIKNVRNPVDRLDAVDKAYVDRIKYKTATGIFLILFWQTIYSSHFPLRKLLPVER